MINPMSLTGKQILVAGALSEIGTAIVSKLIELDADVVMLDNSEDDLQTIQKNIQQRKLRFFSFDIFNNNEIESGFGQINNKYGTFDGFVYCAGIGGARPLALTKLSFVQEMMMANVYSFIEMVRCISKKTFLSQGGSIVALSSVSSIKGLKSKTAYCASKSALDASVRCIAVELSQRKIRVNSILKGWVITDMKKDFIKNNIELSKDNDYSKQLLGFIHPVEVANVTAFLLSDATKTITGTSLLIDGGYTL